MSKLCINPECQKEISDESIYCGHCRTKQEPPKNEAPFFYGDDYVIVRQVDPVITPTREKVNFESLLNTIQNAVKEKNYPFSVKNLEQRWRTEGGKGKPRIVIQPTHDPKWQCIMMCISVEQIGNDTTIKFTVLRKNEMAEFYYATLDKMQAFSPDSTLSVNYKINWQDEKKYRPVIDQAIRFFAEQVESVMSRNQTVHICKTNACSELTNNINTFLTDYPQFKHYHEAILQETKKKFALEKEKELLRATIEKEKKLLCDTIEKEKALLDSKKSTLKEESELLKTERERIFTKRAVCSLNNRKKSESLLGIKRQKPFFIVGAIIALIFLLIADVGVIVSFVVSALIIVAWVTRHNMVQGELKSMELALNQHDRSEAMNDDQIANNNKMMCQIDIAIPALATLESIYYESLSDCDKDIISALISDEAINKIKGIKSQIESLHTQLTKKIDEIKNAHGFICKERKRLLDTIINEQEKIFRRAEQNEQKWKEPSFVDEELEQLISVVKNLFNLITSRLTAKKETKVVKMQTTSGLGGMGFDE